ncbi:MAG: PD-(D/E)XK motif protein [Thermodesulfobacteriota bacterium]|nr:PD-(D/E)XK motif protein [Thermodesulfobacteriota bacterium]
MMKIEKIWQDLESDSSLRSGLLYKRYSGKVFPDIYVALKVPERFRCIAVHLDSAANFDFRAWDKFRDIKIQRLPDEKNSHKHFLVVQLLNGQHKDVFAALSEDLINKVSDITSESNLVKELIERLAKWNMLFEKLGRQGLSEEACRGLYGELYFLRILLLSGINADFCINAWKGIERAVQDFQLSDLAVEVKTTHGKNQQKLHIASERQLDINIIPNIYLVHLSLEVRRDHGETLNQIIEDLWARLNSSPSAQSIFRLKLFEAGYFDNHKEYYDNTGYSIRQQNIYKVTEDFPKITENMIPAGVGDVRYSVVVSANADWMLDEKQLINQVTREIQDD